MVPALPGYRQPVGVGHDVQMELQAGIGHIVAVHVKTPNQASSKMCRLAKA